MELKDIFGLSGKNVVISGAASGMAKAATELLLELGAEVYALDLKPIDLPVKKAIKVNMADQAEIDAMLDELPGIIDAVFLCHGIAVFPGQELLAQKVMFFSHKYITENILSRMAGDGSITYITSNGGFGWEPNIGLIKDLCKCKDFTEAEAWYNAHTDAFMANAYGFAKQSTTGFMKLMTHAPEVINRRIRLNAIGPGLVLTGLKNDFRKMAGGGDTALGKKNVDAFDVDPWNGRPADSKEMGYPLVAIGSKIFSYMSGEIIYIDYGVASSWGLNAVLSAGATSALG